jgi:phospholipid-translocating ATPase
VIMFMAVTLFAGSFTNIVTITFTTLILIELLNVLSEVRKIKRAMVVSILITLLVYLASLIYLRQYF